MANGKAPFLNYDESSENYFLRGSGAKPTIVIGKTQLPKDLDNILIFRSYQQAKALPQEGGIGPEPLDNEDPNPTLQFIKEYFEEGAKKNSSDIGVNEIHFINVGNSPSTEDWIKAYELSKRKKYLQIEAYVGIHDIGFMHSVNAHLEELKNLGLMRNAFFSTANEEMTDAQMVNYTDDSQSQFIRKSKIGIIQKQLFGKFIAKLAVTPYYVEPGFEQFRTIDEGVFKERSIDERDALCSAGIIFGEDRPYDDDINISICLATSTAYAYPEDDRPNDALFHARMNVDYQVREVLNILSRQLKRNETSDNLAYTKEDVISYLDTEIAKERLKGYNIEIVESEGNPYELIAYGDMTPVNSTHAIKFDNHISPPKTKSVSV